MNQQRITLLEDYIRKEPTDPFNYYALAMEYAETDPTRAISLLAQLRSQHAEYLPTYYTLAMLLWDMDDVAKAKEVFETGIKLAETQSASKALAELRSAYQNLLFEEE